MIQLGITVKYKRIRLDKSCNLEAEYTIMRGIENINFGTKKCVHSLIEHMETTNLIQSSVLIRPPHEVLLCPPGIVCSRVREASAVIHFDSSCQ